jgi:hypothetical protein
VTSDPRDATRDSVEDSWVADHRDRTVEYPERTSAGAHRAAAGLVVRSNSSVVRVAAESVGRSN